VVTAEGVPAEVVPVGCTGVQATSTLPSTIIVKSRLMLLKLIDNLLIYTPYTSTRNTLVLT
jgi:hypothetical protein